MEKAILLVDDDEGIRKALGISLKNKGYEVLTAGDGEEGFHHFQKFRPRVVLTDIKMRERDGIELLKKVKEQDPETEVILMTGQGDIDLAVENLKHQATDFITKPVKHDVLEIALERAFERISLKRQARKYSLNRAMYEVVINDLINEDIMVINTDYKILDINDTMLKKLGLEREEVIGNSCFEVSHHRNTPCEGRDHPCPLMESLNTGNPSQVTHVHRDKDGREIHYSISSYPIFENGNVSGVVEISKDITKDISIQKRMMEQEKLASIGQLAAGVAHEINNPLTTILTTAMVTQEDMDPEDPTYEELQTIANETLRCRKIVTGLLDFARQSKPSKKSCSVNDIVHECIALVRKQAAFRDITVESHLAENLPSVQMDHDQILQSLINLALNSIEASEPGGRVSLSTALLSDTEAIQITVMDTGKGIPPEGLSNIFDPFFTSKETGTGLGLAITHGFIERHGGSIDVESHVDVGTTFRISLPIEGTQGPDQAGS